MAVSSMQDHTVELLAPFVGFFGTFSEAEDWYNGWVCFQNVAEDDAAVSIKRCLDALLESHTLRKIVRCLDRRPVRCGKYGHSPTISFEMWTTMERLKGQITAMLVHAKSLDICLKIGTLACPRCCHIV